MSLNHWQKCGELGFRPPVFGILALRQPRLLNCGRLGSLRYPIAIAHPYIMYGFWGKLSHSVPILGVFGLKYPKSTQAKHQPAKNPTPLTDGIIVRVVITAVK